MSAIPQSFPQTTAPTLGPTLASVPLLREVPALLEYRSGADPDAAFIPKTVAGFALGALCMGLTLDFAETILTNPNAALRDLLPGMILRFAFMLGIAGVSTSLLLVGLKVRADHSAALLFARHWLNSIGTGAGYALIMYGPWIILNHSIVVNRFLAAGVWMLFLAFPAFAARWTIGPQKEMARF